MVRCPWFDRVARLVCYAAIYLLACTAILSAAGVTPTGWERASNKWTTVGGAAQDSTGVPLQQRTADGYLLTVAELAAGGTVTANQGTAGTAGWPVKPGAREGVTGRFLAVTDQDQVAVVDTQTATLAGTVTAARVATNPIAGQSGLQGGAGASTANSVRVALATDANTVQLAANQSVNVAQINGVTATMGNGISGTGVQRVTLASDSTGQVALATGANVIGALTANQSTNTAQINGVAPTMGNGISGTGVQRVTLASDSTGQVTLATGANTIGALTANQSVNTAQINGVAPTMGNGASGTGVQRVTLASDSTGQVTLAAGSATIGALTANQSTNTAQINGVAPSMGNGTSGTGVQRVTLASDSTGQVATEDALLIVRAGSQYNLALAASTALTVPGSSTRALIMAEGGAIRWTDDGTVPTATTGMRLLQDAALGYKGTLSALRFIRETAGGTINVQYYDE